MKCVLSGPNARIFAKGVQSLSKFGPSLYVEADQNGFQLRAVNANKSAVATFKFYCGFFESYEISNGSSGEENFCRLSMKASLGVFKNMKQVETCHIEPTNSKFLVKMNCRHETVKHFVISIIDDDNISADVPMDDAPNLISGPHKIFSEIASNFKMSEEEITMEARKENLIVKNYVEGCKVNDQFMRSQLKLSSDEFDEYTIAEDEGTWVTFCLREFKAFLLFCESLNERVNIKFHDAGSPIIFQTKKNGIFDGTLIMSTLSPNDVTMCEDLQPREITESFVAGAAQKRKHQKPDSTRQSKRLNSSSTTTSISEKPISSEETPDFRFDVESIDIPRNDAISETSDERPRIPSISTVSNPTAESESEVFVTFVETEENAVQDEEIPQSPGSNHRRGLRSIFSRCFEATYVPREPSPTSHGYVADSGEEN